MSKRRRKRRRPANRVSNNSPANNLDLDKLFCINAKKYGFEKLMLKAVATVESSLQIQAYRFEQGFWDRYLKDNDEWKDRDPNEVSASYGLMQLMFVVAHELGFRGTAAELYNPAINIALGSKLLKKWVDKAKEDNVDVKHQLWPVKIALAAYNGGYRGNPQPDGSLRNQGYVDKVFTEWARLREVDNECDD